MGIIAIELMFGDSFGLLYTFLLALIFIMKFLYLPIMYFFLEKYSQNKVVKTFIYNLKNKKNFRRNLFILVSIPTIILALIASVECYYELLPSDEYYYNLLSFTDYCDILFYVIKTFIEVYVAYFVIADLQGSYVVLFLWWWIRGELK